MLGCGVSDSPVAPGTGGVAVTQVEPEGPVVTQDTADLAEHLDDVLDVELGSGFKADLIIDSIITQAPVRWAGYHAVDGEVFFNLGGTF